MKPSSAPVLKQALSKLLFLTEEARECLKERQCDLPTQIRLHRVMAWSLEAQELLEPLLD